MHWTPRLLKIALNLYPPYLGAGIRVLYISPDWRDMKVSMKLRFFNRNAVGCHFGGSLYSMVDPHLMLLLMRILGKGFIVWDHSASIRFRKPGQGRVTAHIHITDAQLDDILKKTAGGEKFLPEFKLTVVSAENEAIADISKTLYIRKKKEI